MDNYKLLIKDLVPLLRTFGYQKSGNSFFYNQGGNIGLINFQKSMSSNALLFTINLGVYSTRLKVFDNFEINAKPTISDCHWRKRIGELINDKQDYWWRIDHTISMPRLITEIAGILKEYAIPDIEKNISDESLRKSWMEGNCEGLSEPQMYLYLIAMLKGSNSIDLQIKINELKEKVKDKPFYTNVKENLLKLGIT